ncbi:MAG: hypothetical protein JNL21_07135 [Myxococcales bacterium]|nr:hypothetical protein [Myxococcales bacterium]
MFLRFGGARGGGSFGVADFGGGPLLNLNQTLDVIVAKYDVAGNHLWSRDFGDLEEQFMHAMTVDPSGNVLVTGEFYGTMDFGSNTLTSAGIRDIILAKLEP